MAQIKSLLSEESQVLDHFNNQVRVLEQKASALQEGAKTLKSIVNSVDRHKSIPWETIIQLIEVYKMTENLEHNWVKEIFTPDELKQYVEFENQLKANKSPEQKAAFEKQWQQLLAELKQSLTIDPESAPGIQMGKKYMEWVNNMYGKKYAHLKTKKWEQGFGEGKGLKEIGLTVEIVNWIEKATNAYWRDRIEGILNLVGKQADSTVLSLWNEALDDLYGEEEARKQTIYQTILSENRVSPEAKQWLKNLLKSK